MSILWKMAVFTEKPPISSSNSYESMKNASILIQLGTNVDWTIAFVTTCSVLNFLLPWQRGDISKLSKSLFCLDFFHQNWFQSAATSQGIEIKSKAFQRGGFTLPYDWPGIIFSLSQVQNFLGLQTFQTEGGTSPLLATPWYTFWMGGGAEKVLTFFSNISQTKTCVWGPNRTFCTISGLKEGGGVESAFFRVYMR
jgi:hypothetical protein